VTRALLALLLALDLAACGHIAAPGAEPAATRAVLAATVVAARQAEADAEAGGRIEALAERFGGAALRLVVARIERLRAAGARLEVQFLRETLVHWDGGRGAGSAVLEVLSQEQVVGLGPPGPWARRLEQWDARVTWDGRWRVTEAYDLSPSAWWRG
jgi:hypothetical protein